MNFAVLLVPDFALHAARRSDATLRNKPFAIITGEGRKAAVAQVSAEAAGAEPGLAVTLAMARCPGIILRPRDPQSESDSQRLLVASAFTLSPRVEVTEAGCCTIDLLGADEARTERAMHAAVVELARLGLPARAGAAATPLLALYAARQTQSVLMVRDRADFLRDLPVATAEPTVNQAEVLHNWGIRSLGQLTALQKAEIGRRLGTDGVALWERAAGEAVRLLRLTLPARAFVANWDYEPGIDNIDPLFFKLQRFAECVALELRGAGFVAEALTLTLLLEDDTDYRREFRLAEPGTDVESWLKVLHSHMKALRLAARVVEVRFVASPTRPQVKQDGLFDTGLKDPHAFWENLGRVAAILGEGRVGTPVMADTWRPDAFELVRPAESVPPPEAASVHPARGGVLRRFRPAKPVLVALEDGQPVALNGAVTGSVRGIAGPWRHSGGWWQAGGWAVETWHVAVGRETYQLVRSAEGWAVEGEID